MKRQMSDRPAMSPSSPSRPRFVVLRQQWVCIASLLAFHYSSGPFNTDWSACLKSTPAKGISSTKLSTYSVPTLCSVTSRSRAPPTVSSSSSSSSSPTVWPSSEPLVPHPHRSRHRSCSILSPWTVSPFPETLTSN